MSASILKTTILPKLLSGSRDGLPLDAIGATSSLQAMALAGHMLRFERPLQPGHFDVEETVHDDRAIMSGEARTLLLRLQSGKNQTSDRLSAAIVRKLVERRLRLHPFDFPKLEAFVKKHAEDLGAEALAFSERETPTAQKQNYFAPDRLSDENWMLATPAVKAGYIARRRAVDPAAARQLVEAAWGTENADSRVRLLGTFREHLSEADLPFLEGLEKDRAPRVRELALRFRLKLPGYEGDNPSLREALGRIKVEKGGLIFKKTSLTLELPATVRDYTKLVWLNETFSPIGLETLAAALSLTVEGLVAGAEKDSDLLVALLLMATQDKRLDIVHTITERHLSDGWRVFTAAEGDLLADYTADMRRAWVADVFRPNRWEKDVTAWVLRPMSDLLNAEAGEDFFRDLLGSKTWQGLQRDNSRFDSDVLESLAVICPPGFRPQLRNDLAPLEPAKSSNATLFLDLMDSLETVNA